MEFKKNKENCGVFIICMLWKIDLKSLGLMCYVIDFIMNFFIYNNKVFNF